MAVYHPSHLSAELNIDKILSSHAKEFIASAEVNDLGQQYVELKMYDFLSFPWSLEKLRDYRDKQEEGTLEHYPYALLAEYAKDFIVAVKIDDQGNSYVELRMYDFLGMPLTDEEILESVEKEKRSIDQTILTRRLVSIL